MRSQEGKRSEHIARAVAWTLAAIAALLTCSPRQSLAQQDEFSRFRNALIDYFKPQSYFPILVNKGYTVGDVVNVDGVNFYARAARCFPNLHPPSPVAAALTDVVETNSAGMSFGLRLRQLFDSSVGADLVRRIQLRFFDVTTVSVALLDLKDALDRQRCPEIAPLIDGTITAVDRSKKPYFVVSEVVYGKREAELKLKANADVHAQADRLGRQIGDANLKLTASGEGLVTLTSDVVVPIAVRPVTVPSIVPINAFDLRSSSDVGLKWEPVDCAASQACAARFAAFSDLSKQFSPALSPEELER
jgi:hypothetical protein